MFYCILKIINILKEPLILHPICLYMVYVVVFVSFFGNINQLVEVLIKWKKKCIFANFFLKLLLFCPVIWYDLTVFVLDRCILFLFYYPIKQICLCWLKHIGKRNKWRNVEGWRISAYSFVPHHVHYSPTPYSPNFPNWLTDPRLSSKKMKQEISSFNLLLVGWYMA